MSSFLHSFLGNLSSHLHRQSLDMVFTESRPFFFGLDLHSSAFNFAFLQQLLGLFANRIDVLFGSRRNVFPVEHLRLRGIGSQAKCFGL